MVTKAWKRPSGCECDATRPKTEKCTSASDRAPDAETWMRCPGRISFVHKTRTQRARERRYG